MPGNVDERVVSMRFDNKQFEKGIAETSKSLDNFQKKLDVSKSSNGLKKIGSVFAGLGKGGLNVLQKSANKTVGVFQKLHNVFNVGKATKGLKELGGVTFEGLQTSMNSLGEKLEGLGSIGEMAMYRIKNAILDAAQSAIQFGKSMSIDQISAGLSKYEQKISSIKTISNATGIAADAVNSQLDRLNWFTDETSASFSEMVNNIGKFTSVGRGLDESITAMQGIATWGYHSGANVQEINRAMYNLSQALGTGSVKLMDWKSIENAGMATKEFKEQAIAAAEAAGTLVRKNNKLFTKNGNKEVNASNFNQTLAQGWFSSDVLMATLEEYGSFATKVKEYQEKHPGLLASEAIAEMDKERIEKQNKIYDKYLSEWTAKTNKSTEAVKDDIARINKIANTKEREKEIKKFAQSIGTSVTETKKILDDLAESEESLGEKAFKSSQQSKSFTDSLEATKDAVSTQWMNSFQIIFGGLEDSIQLWSDVTEVLWDLFASGGASRNNILTQWAETFHGRENLFGRMNKDGEITGGVLHNIADTIMSIKEMISGSFVDTLFPGIREALDGAVTDSDRASNAINGVYTEDQILWKRKGNYWGWQLSRVTTAMENFTKKVKDFFEDETNVQNISNILKGIFSVFIGIGRTIGAVAGGFSDFLEQSGAAAKVLEVFGGIGERITEFFSSLEYNGVFGDFRKEITDTLMGFDGILDNLDLSFVTSSLKAIFSIFKGGWKFIKSVLNGVSKFLRESKILNKVLKLFNQLASRVESFFNSVFNNKLMQEISDTITTMLTDVGSLIDDIDLSFVSAALQGIFSIVKGIAGFIKPIVSGVARGLKKSGALKTVSKIATNISNAVTKFFNTIKNNGDYEKFEQSIADLVANFASLFDGLDLSGLDNFFMGAWGIIKTAWNGIKTVFNSFIDFLNIFGIPQAVVDALSTIGGWFSWFSDKMEEFHVWEDLSEHIKSGLKKVKEVFDHFKEEIGRFLEDSGIAAKFREWKEKLKQWLFPDSLDENGEVTGIAKIFKNIRDAFNNGIEKLKNAKVYDWLMEKWQWLKDSGIIEGLKDFWNNIKALFGGGKDAKEAGENAEQGEKTLQKQGGFFETLKGLFSNIDFGTIVGAAIGFAAIFLAFKVVSSITGLIKKVTKVVTGVGEFISGLGDVTSALAKRLKKASKFLQIGIMIAAIGAAIWMIADAITKLGKLSTEELIRGGIAVVLCAGIILGMVFIMKKLQKDGNTIKLGDMVGIVLLSFCLTKVAEAVCKLGQLSLEQALIGIGGLAAIMALILLFMLIVKKIGKVGVDIGFLFTIGDAMIKLSDVVVKLGAMNPEELAQGLAGLTIMMVMLALFMKATSKTIDKKNVKNINQAGFLKLIGLAIVMLILARIVMKLSQMSWEQMARGLAGLTVIMLLLAAFMKTTTKKVGFLESAKNTAGLFKMIGFAIVMVVMAIVLKRLSNMSWDQIARGLVAMTGIVILLAIFSRTTTKKVSFGEFAKNTAGLLKMIGMAIAMAILAAVLKSLSNLSWEQIAKGLVAMAGIMVLMVLFIKATTKTFSSFGERLLTKNQAGIFKILGIAVAMAILGAVFRKLAALEWEQIGKGIVAMAAIMAMVLIFIKSTGKITVRESAKAVVTFGIMIGLGIAVSLFALSLRSLASLPIEGIIKGVIGLAGILIAVGVFMKTTSKLTNAGGLIKGLLVLLPIAAAMGAFVLALHFVKDIDPSIVAAFGVSLGIIVAAMAEMLGVITIAGKIPIALVLKGTIVVAACLVILLAAATAIVAGLGALANIAPGFKKALESGVEVLGLIGKAFGALIGEFLGGVLGGIAGSLPKFAEGIEIIGKSVKSFSQSISGVKGVTKKDRDAAFGTILALVGIAWLLPRKGGLMQLIFGQGDLADFAKEIGDLGKGLKNFCNSIRGLSRANKPEDIKAAMTTAYDLANFAKFVTDPGSLGDILRGGIAKFMGVNTTFDGFISQIEPFGKSLKAYSKAIKGIEKTSGSSDAAISIAEDILEFKNKIEDPGTIGDILLNWFASITGQKTTFQDFIDNIEPFGQALQAYGKAIGGFSKKVTEDDASSALNAAEGIKGFADKFKANSFDEAFIDAIENVFGGGDYIAKFDRFISQIQPFGDAIKAYAQTIAGFGTALTPEDASAALSAADGIKGFADKFKANSFDEAFIDAIENVFGGGDYIAKFSRFNEQIGPFGTAIKTYAETISGFSTTLSDTDADAAISAALGIQKFADNFKSESLGEAVLRSIDNLFGGGDYIAQFSRFNEQMPLFGAGLKAYASGISKIAVVSEEDRTSALQAAEGLKAFAQSFNDDELVEAEGKGVAAFIADTVCDMFSGGKNDMSEFVTFSEGMMKFGQGLTNYAKGIKDIVKLEPGQADSAIQTAEAVKKFALSLRDAANEDNTWFDDLLEFSTSVFGTEGKSDYDELNTFGKAMGALGEGISAFATAAGKVEVDTSGKAIEAINTVAELANSELLDDVTTDNGGLWSKIENFFGGSKVGALITFANDMKTFGEAVSGFAEAIQEYPTEELPIDRAVKAVKDYLGAVQALTSDDSIVKIMGYNGTFIDFIENVSNSDDAQRRYQGMLKFVGHMKTFGESISTFADAVKDYESPKGKSWDQLKASVKEMSDFAVELNKGGYYEGGWSLSNLATDMANSAPDFIKFSKIINGTLEEFNYEYYELQSGDKLETIAKERMDTITYILTLLSTTVQALSKLQKPNNQYLRHDEFYNLAELGKDAAEIGKGLASVFDSLNKINTDDVAPGGKIDKILEFIARFQYMTLSFKDLKNNNFYDIGDFGKDIKDFFDNAQKINWNNINVGNLVDASMAVSMLAFAAARIKEASLTSGDLTTLQEIIGLLVGLNGTEEADDGSETLAKNFVFNFCKYLNSEVNTAVTEKTGSAWIAGHNITIGFANGIYNDTVLAEVVKAAGLVTEAAIKSMMVTADENSPSKVTQQIGYYMSKGMALGLGQDDSEIQNKAESAVGLALSAFSAALDEDPDEQPTITPVVDLTNVEAGAAAAGAMFGGRYSLGVDTSAGLAGKASQPGSKIENTTNVTVDTSSVATTIDTMNAKLEQLAARMTNLQVVLNSGALVGQIAPQMNRELGRMANRSVVS